MRFFTKILVLIIFISLETQAQKHKEFSVEGFILNAQTSAPIPYANIGILNTEIGTLSNEDGSFSIRILAKYTDQNIIFSSIGYEQKSITVNDIDLSKPLKILLKELVGKLEEVVVTSEKFEKQKEVFGNGKSLLLNGLTKGDTLYAGAAAALLIDKHQYPDLTYIQEASLYIARNKMPSFKVRMRLMAVDSTNGLKPGDDILFEQVVIQSSIKKGWLKFPLEKVHQIENDAFYLMFEWILNKEDRKYIHDVYEEYFNAYPENIRYDTTIVDGEVIMTNVLPRALAGTFFGITSSTKDLNSFLCYSRNHSFGEWDRLAHTLSAKIKIANYPLEPNSIERKTRELSITDSITQWAESFREEQNIPGLQLAVMKNDSLMYSNAFGYSDQLNKVKANPTTQFRIASVSKTLTSAGIMKLVSEGKVDLDESVREYVPTFPQKKYPIKVRQLLSHLGGIRDYYGVSWKDELFIQEHYNSSNEAISIFSNDSLVAEPGTQFVYSSFGYTLLGAIIESASDQSYLDYMSNEIWRPLKMSFTYGDIADSTMNDKSKFYFLTGEEASPYDLSYIYPSGGLVSTSEDLVKFGSMLLNGKLLDESSLDQTFNTQYTSKDEPTGYGLGWYLGKDSNDTKAWYHAGELPSSGSFVVIYPEHNLVITLLANSPIISEADDGFSDEIQRLGEIIYNH
ncbi:serine hydrolase [Ekhidna sp.]